MGVHDPQITDYRSLARALAYRPTGVVRESFVLGPDTGAASQGLLVSGTLHMCPIFLVAGDVVVSLNWLSGSTPANGPTHQWSALFSSARGQLAISADATSAAWAGSFFKSFAMGTPYTVPTTGIYYAGLLVTATTAVPTLIGSSVSAAAQALWPFYAYSADAGLTTPGTCPSTAAAPVSPVGGPSYVATK